MLIYFRKLNLFLHANSVFVYNNSNEDTEPNNLNFKAHPTYHSFLNLDGFNSSRPSKTLNKCQNYRNKKEGLSYAKNNYNDM